MVHRICLPFVDPELCRQLELGGNPDSHHPSCEWWLSLLDQSIHSYWSACPNIDGIKMSIQISNFLGGGIVSALGSLIISVRQHPSLPDFHTVQSSGLTGRLGF